MGSNIVHQYFKKEEEGAKILIKVNPIHLRGVEIVIDQNGNSESREIEFGEQIVDELKKNGYTESSPLEFNLYDAGLAG
jgi:hypothetical protein